MTPNEYFSPEDPRIRELLEKALDSNSSPEEVCRDYPELLAEVRAEWERVRIVEAEIDALFPKSGVRTETGGAGSVPKLPDIPGHKVESVLGHGGMGVVYRARDLNLNRDVAVKLLQNRYPSDSLVARRFAEEARITAQLQHPGIPPVHDLGTLPDGRPFLAMKLINGSTLDQLLAARSNPSDNRGRFVATFEQVCHAVGYAHAHNVIHRDLKPSNVMVGAFGEVQVMDWGLAKVLTGRACSPPVSETALKADAATTLRLASKTPHESLPGDLFGTPAFMSPEQAMGAVNRIDARSDVYSLGGILCAILTGKPPHVAHTSEAARKLAAQARLEEARARLAACGAEPELVALCLRCLAPVPENRPQYAGEVAAAVAALRTRAEERARQAELDSVQAIEQGKRRRVLLAASVAIVVVLLAGLSFSLWQMRRVGQERDVKAKALVAEQEARELTMTALRDLTDDVVENQLARDTQLTEESKEFLRKIIKHFESFAALTADDAASRAIRAEGHARVGIMRHRLGELHDAEAAIGIALDLRKQNADEFPTRPELRQELARSHASLANLLRSTGRLKEAEATYVAALALQKQLVSDFPTRPEFRKELARSHNNFSNLLQDTGRSVEAEAACRAALTLLQQLVTEFPDRPEFRSSLATSHNILGILLRTDRPKEAEEAYAAALALQEHLVAHFPTRAEFRQDLARRHQSLGNLLGSTGRPKEAEAAHRAALAIRKQLAADFPIRPEFREELALSHYNLGVLMRIEGRPREAEAENSAALDLRKQLADDFPTRPELRQQLASSHNFMGMLLRDTGQIVEAEEAQRAALDVQTQLVIDFPTRPELRQDLAQSHNNLGTVLHNAGRLKETEAEYRAALDLRKQLVIDFPDRADLGNALAGTCVNLATLCNQLQDFQAAKAYLEEARPHHQAALKANPRHPTYRKFFRNNLWTLARANAGLLDQESSVQVAETIRELGWDPPGNDYDAASALALCIPIAAKHDKLDAAQREQAATFYGDAAMKLLRDAVSNGYKDAARMKEDIALEALRPRDDFQKLLAELEGRGK